MSRNSQREMIFDIKKKQKKTFRDKITRRRNKQFF